MADTVEGIDEGLGDDVDMVPAESGEAEEYEADIANELPDLPDVVETSHRVAFLDYLRSPIVRLVIGNGENETHLSAHYQLLCKSPLFQAIYAPLIIADPNRSLDQFQNEDLEAMGSFLEYLYVGEYFPRRKGEGRDAQLESDPSIPVPDHDGEQLLKHARVYNLGEMFQMPALKSLALSKIHATTSTAKGELAYARYIYSTTPADDKARRPIAAFWATRSHILRHDAEDEFRAVCLEIPQFGFDVLSQVLDQKEKQRGGSAGGEASVTIESGTPTTGGRGKKRQRMSGI